MEYRLTAIPDDFWREVRIYCIQHRTTAKKLIISLLKKEIERHLSGNGLPKSLPEKTD